MLFEIVVGKREIHSGVWAAGKFFSEGRHVVDLPESMVVGVNKVPTLWLLEEQAGLGLTVVSHEKSGDAPPQPTPTPMRQEAQPIEAQPAPVPAPVPAPTPAPAPAPSKHRR